MIDLYKNIKSRRIELGMTQEELGKKCGYTNRSSIATIEAGKIDLPLSKAKEIANALECSVTYLMGWEDGEDDDQGLIYAEESAIRQKRIDKFPPEAIVELDTFIDYLEVKYSLK